MGKPMFWFPTCSDLNQAVQLQKMGLAISGLENRGIELSM